MPTNPASFDGIIEEYLHTNPVTGLETLDLNAILDHTFTTSITRTLSKMAISKEPTPAPKTLDECHVLISTLRLNMENYKNQVRSARQDFDNLYAEYKEMQKQLNNAIDIEEAYDLISKYCKHNKMDWKPAKNGNIVKQFIAMLDFRLVPIDDDLVD